jgi:hypothetical protein
MLEANPVEDILSLTTAAWIIGDSIADSET